MKQVMLCVAVVVALAALTLAAVFTHWLPVLCGVLGGVALSSVRYHEVRMRDWRVRRLIVAAYGTDAPHTRAGDIVRVLATPDVLEARRAYLRRESERYAQLVANGQCSDR